MHPEGRASSVPSLWHPCRGAAPSKSRWWRFSATHRLPALFPPGTHASVPDANTDGVPLGERHGRIDVSPGTKCASTFSIGSETHTTPFLRGKTCTPRFLREHMHRRSSPGNNLNPCTADHTQHRISPKTRATLQRTFFCGDAPPAARCTAGQAPAPMRSL